MRWRKTWKNDELVLDEKASTRGTKERRRNHRSLEFGIGRPGCGCDVRRTNPWAAIPRHVALQNERDPCPMSTYVLCCPSSLVWSCSEGGSCRPVFQCLICSDVFYEYSCCRSGDISPGQGKGTGVGGGRGDKATLPVHIMDLDWGKT